MQHNLMWLVHERSLSSSQPSREPVATNCSSNYRLFFQRFALLGFNQPQVAYTRPWVPRSARHCRRLLVWIIRNTDRNSRLDQKYKNRSMANTPRRHRFVWLYPRSPFSPLYRDGVFIGLKGQIKSKSSCFSPDIHTIQRH